MPSDWGALSVKKRAERLRGLRLVWLFYRAIPVCHSVRGNVRSFGQFKQELAGFSDEAENFRAENAVLSEQVVVLTARVREAQG